MQGLCEELWSKFPKNAELFLLGVFLIICRDKCFIKSNILLDVPADSCRSALKKRFTPVCKYLQGVGSVHVVYDKFLF